VADRIEELFAWWMRRRNCDVAGRHSLGRLKAAGAEVDFIRVKHAGHDFRPAPGARIAPSAKEILAKTIQFFGKHLRPGAERPRR